MARMPPDVDKRPRARHFAGPWELRFYTTQSPRAVVVLHFETRADALLFRKGFRRGVGKELQRFVFPCPWLSAGVDFCTPWHFFAQTWDLDPVPTVVAACSSGS